MHKYRVNNKKTPLFKHISVGYEHRLLEILLGSLENLPARRALMLTMLEKNFA